MKASYSKYYEQVDFWGRSVDKLNPSERDRIMTIVHLIPEDVNTILDIGCGDGVITNVLGEKYDITGLDISQEALKYVKTKTMLSTCDNIPVDDNSYDLVMCCDVLEHLPVGVYERTINEMKRISSKYILINTPYKERLLLNFTKCNVCGCTFHLYRHLRSFTENKLKTLFPEYTMMSTKLCGSNTPYRFKILHKIKHSIGIWAWKETALCPACGNNITKPSKINRTVYKLFVGIELAFGYLFPLSRHKAEIVVLIQIKERDLTCF